MTESSWPEHVELSDYLSDVPTSQLKLRLPIPVVTLVGELMSQVSRRTAVQGTSELIGALLVKAALEIQDLDVIVGDYRETRVHSVMTTSKTDGPFRLPSRRELK